ncbi:MAG TPA: NAD-dependent epimerase/dehydratase family protein [Acidimicrobiales bacterium]|nr:NAD-dependent epimerase/dehydratase family protein [Acidimicrobiales bacterium]
MAVPARGDGTFWRHRPVAVTGATGFLGSHLVHLLVDRGADVVILERDRVPVTPVRAAWSDRVSVVHGSLEDTAVVERMLGEYGPTTVFHLAAQTQVEVANLNPVSTFESNVRGTWSLLEACRRTPTAASIVVASSDKAYGRQPVLPYTEDMPLLGAAPYDASKACADILATTYARTYGLPVAVTRCGNFFGPGDVNWRRLVPGVVRSVLEGQRPVIRSDGTPTRDYLYVVDGAAANMQLAEALAGRPDLAGEAFNFSTESPLSVLELVEAIQKAAGTALAPDIRGRAEHEIPHQYLSAAKARRVLAWSPQHPLADALEETLGWYRAVLGAGRG